jgi:hypothetical protein
MGKFFSQAFKMAAIFKMTQKLVFDHKSVYFEKKKSVTFLNFRLVLEWNKFHKKKFFVRLKMAYNV